MLSPFYYVGSKAKLASKIIERFPAAGRIDRYFEPMCGSAAVYLAAAEDGSEGFPVILSDANPELIYLLQAIRSTPRDVHQSAQTYAALLAEATDPKAAYIHLRGLYNGPRRTSHGLQLILRQAAFNGLWRVNARGEMNVPPRPARELVDLRLPSLDEIERMSDLLRYAEIINCPYQEIAEKQDIGDGDLVYLDPPYWSDDNAGFTAYTVMGFHREDQVQLIQQAAAWAQAGAHVIYSNADHPDVRAWLDAHWPDAGSVTVQVDRTVAADSTKRGAVTELIVTGDRNMPRKKTTTASTTTALTASTTTTPTVIPTSPSTRFFTRLNANVKVPISAEIGQRTMFVGGNQQGKSAGLLAVRAALTGRIPGIVHGKDIAEFVQAGAQNMSAELSNGTLSACFSAEVGKKLPDGPVFSDALRAVLGGNAENTENILPAVAQRDLLGRSAEKARELLMRRFGALDAVPLPRGLDEEQARMWTEAQAASAAETPAGTLARMQSWFDSTSRTANTRANALERTLDAARELAFEMAGSELIPDFERQRERALAFEGLAQSRAALVAAEAVLAGFDTRAAEVIRLHEAAIAAKSSASAGVEAARRAATELGTEARALKQEAENAQERLRRSQDALALIDRVLAAGTSPSCPFCGAEGRDWPARRAIVEAVVEQRRQALTAAAQWDALQAQAASTIATAERTVITANDRERRAHEARLSLKAEIALVKGQAEALRAARAQVEEYTGPSSAELRSRIDQLRQAQATKLQLEQSETEIRALRRSATTAKALKDEAKRYLTNALRSVKDTAEAQANRYLAQIGGIRVALELSDTTCEWQAVGAEGRGAGGRAPGRQALCGSELAALTIALALAWTEGESFRVLTLDDEDLAMLEPRNLQAMLGRVDEIVERGLVDQVFAAWPAARLDHSDEIPAGWTVVRVGGCA